MNTPDDSIATHTKQLAPRSTRLPWLIAVLGVALVGALALTGRFGTDLATQAHAAEDHALVGQPAPPFAVRTLDGNRAASRDAKGSVLVLDFWATWCPPCVRALPVLKDTVDSFQDSETKVHLVAMNIREDKRTIKRFLEDQGLQDLNVGLDAHGDVAEAYLVKGIPQSVVIDPNGMVTAVHVGFSPNLGEQLAADINAAIAAGAATASAE